MSIDQTETQLSQQIVEQSPDVLAISLTSRQWLRAKSFINQLRKQCYIPTITGGLHPTFAPESVLQEPGFDYVCLGEGEGAFVDFLNVMDTQGYVTDGQISLSGSKGATDPHFGHHMTQSTPSHSWQETCWISELRRHQYDHSAGLSLPLYLLRSPDNTMRFTPATAEDEALKMSLMRLRQIRDKGPLNYIIFLDDTFTINHKWVREFCRVYPDKIGVSFSLHARVETINQGMLKDLAKAGCAHITFGVESGSERVRREIMDRKISNQRLIDAFKWSKDAGIITTANYIIGTPTETVDDLEATIALHHQLQPDDFGYFVFYPYPGTPMYHYCKSNGLLPANFDTLPANHRQSVLIHDTLSHEDIEHYYERLTQNPRSRLSEKIWRSAQQYWTDRCP